MFHLAPKTWLCRVMCEKISFLQPEKVPAEIGKVIMLASSASTNIHYQPFHRVLLQRSPGCVLGMGVIPAQGESLSLRVLGLFARW